MSDATTEGTSSDLPGGMLAADRMAYAARALAQSEPFTPLARRLFDEDMAAERKAQPGNFAVWANAAYTKGYCVRRVEEDDVGMELVSVPDESLPDVAKVVEVTNTIVTALRSDDVDLRPHLISNEERLLDVLDQVIGSEVRNRADSTSSTISSRARMELEDYLTFWVVKGYALRAAEAETGAIVPRA